MTEMIYDIEVRVRAEGGGVAELSQAYEAFLERLSIHGIVYEGTMRLVNPEALR